VDAGSKLTLQDSISGSGPMTFMGGGIVSLEGASGNSYSGDTIVSQGTLELNKPQFVVSVPGNLIVGPAPTGGSPAVARFEHTGELGGTVATVNANSLLDLNGNNLSLVQLNLNDGGNAQTGAGALGFAPGGQVVVGSQSPSGSHATSTISGILALPANDIVTFNVGLHAPTPPILFTPELDVTAVIPVPVENPSFAPAGIRKEGLGRMRLGGNNTYQGSTTVNGGTLQADGSQPQTFAIVNSGARLQGAGTLGNIYLNSSSAVLAPGDSPGILGCGSFDAGGGSGILEVELNGTTLGSGYDQLDVVGSVTLTGVTLNPILNFASSVGDQFTIINNDHSDAVIGTFTGLPQGTNLYIGGQLFQISYTGGTGNDVVLTRLTTPPPPTIAIKTISSSSIVFSWPTNDPAFTLQSITDLSSNNWTTVSPGPAIVGPNYVVSNTPSGPRKFYRLIKP
jgi:autotransporter-associated beta strand protein